MVDFNNIPGKMIYWVQYGSHLYGTNTERSDLDYKGIYLPYARNLILGNVKPIYNYHPDKVSINGRMEKNTTTDVDIEVFSLKQYLHLLVHGQTIALDMLFATRRLLDTTDVLEGTVSPEWLIIWDNREKFISKEMTSFVQYCRTQAKKYSIKGDRVNAVRQVVDFLDILIKAWGIYNRDGSLIKLNQYRDNIQMFVSEQNNEFIKVVSIPNNIEIPIDYLECCDRKASFTMSIKEAYSSFKKLLDNYGARALSAEKSKGADWKALSHSVRIAYEALELLRTGNITFPLIDVEYIRQIKNGKLEFDEISSHIDFLLNEVETELTKSNLPLHVNEQMIEDLLYKFHTEVIRSELWQ